MLFPKTMLPRPAYKHIAPALLVGLGLRLFFIWRFPFASDNTFFYEKLARNWLYHGILRLLRKRTSASLGHVGSKVSGIPKHHLLFGRSQQNARADCAGVG